ncbi:hypothetical protein pb186bvf_003369 [Paramecium bursaria]
MSSLTEFSLDIIKKFQTFFSHMDKRCQEFLTTQGVEIRAESSQKKKPIRLPDQPKKYLSGYMIFTQSYRQKILAQRPDLKITDIAKLAGQRWSQMTDEQKRPWQEQSDIDRERYETEMHEFRQKNNIEEPRKRSKSKVQNFQFIQQGDDKSIRSIGEIEDHEESEIPNKILHKTVENKNDKKKSQKIAEKQEQKVVEKQVEKQQPKVNKVQKTTPQQEDDIQEQIENFMKNKESPQKLVQKKVKK